MKWYWTLLIVVIAAFLWGWIKSTKQMVKLQKMAQRYPTDFQVYVMGKEGWQYFEQDHDGKDCIKLIPDPQLENLYYYYIKYTGSGSEGRAINSLIKDFEYYIHVIRKK